MSGASGQIYGIRLLEVLRAARQPDSSGRSLGMVPNLRPSQRSRPTWC